MEDWNDRMAAMQAEFQKEREDLTARLRVQEAANQRMREEAKRKAANRESQTKLERSRKERSLGTSFAGQGGGNAADRRGTAVSAMDSMLTRGVSTGADLGQPLQNFPRGILPKLPVECSPSQYIAWEQRFEAFLTDQGLCHTISSGAPEIAATSDTNNADLFGQFGEDLVMDHRLVWWYISEATADTAFEDRLYECLSISDALRIMREWSLPLFPAQRHLLVAELERVRFMGDEESGIVQFILRQFPERPSTPHALVVGRGFRDWGAMGVGTQRRDDHMVSRGAGMPQQQQPQQHWSRGGGIPWQQQHQQQRSRSGGIHQHQRSFHVFPPARKAQQQQPLEEWGRSENMESSMFSLSEGPHQSEPTAVAFAATAPAAEAVTGTSVFPAVLSKGVTKTPTSPAGTASTAVPAAAPATGDTVFPDASVERVDGKPTLEESFAGTAASDAVAEAAPLTGDTAAPDASVERVDGKPTLEESFAGTAASDAVAEAAPLTGDTAAPDASVERVAGKLILKAGSSSEICGERGASTHPFDPGTMFPLEVRYASSSSNGNSSSSNHKDVAYVGALLRPFDPGKRCRRGGRIEKAVRGLDLPFDRGKTSAGMMAGAPAAAGTRGAASAPAVAGSIGGSVFPAASAGMMAGAPTAAGSRGAAPAVAGSIGGSVFPAASAGMMAGAPAAAGTRGAASVPAVVGGFGGNVFPAESVGMMADTPAVAGSSGATFQAASSAVRPPPAIAFASDDHEDYQGFYDRSYCEVKNWHQSSKLMQAPRIWNALKAKHPDATVFVHGLWHGMHDPSIDFFVNVRPQYLQNGGKIADLYTYPAGLREELQGGLGTFPIHRFWGLGTSIESSKWMADAAVMVDKDHDPTLTLVYLPHLDYSLQKYGPPATPSEGNGGGSPRSNPGNAESKVHKDLTEIDKVVKGMIDYYESKAVGARVVILSEYAIARVERPVYLNRVLRENRLVQVRKENGGETLDCGECRAFALCDHQVAHVHVRYAADIPLVRRVLEATSGVEKVMDAAELNTFYRGKARGDRRAAPSRGAHHLERSGDLVVMSDSSSWFAYYYWMEDSKAPDFARCVAIHRKPDYDPAEMFFRYPGFLGFAWLMFKLLLVYGLKLRAIVDGTPLRCDGIRGSHGRLPVGDEDPRPLILFRKKVAETSVATGTSEAVTLAQYGKELGPQACVDASSALIAEDVSEVLWRILMGEI